MKTRHSELTGWLGQDLNTKYHNTRLDMVKDVRIWDTYSRFIGKAHRSLVGVVHACRPSYLEDRSLDNIVQVCPKTTPPACSSRASFSRRSSAAQTLQARQISKSGESMRWSKGCPPLLPQVSFLLFCDHMIKWLNVSCAEYSGCQRGKRDLFPFQGFIVSLKTYARSRRCCRRLIAASCQSWFRGAFKGFFSNRKSRLE